MSTATTSRRAMASSAVCRCQEAPASLATQELALLTVPEVMAALRLGRSSVYALIRRRELASLTIGRARRIPRTALTTYLNHRTEEAS